MESKKYILAKDLTWVPFGKGLERHIMGYNDELMVVKVRFEKGGIAPLHSHPHTQSSYIASGKYEFTVGDETMTVSSGDGVLIKPNEPHQCVCLEEGIVIDTFSPMREDFI